MVCSIAVHLVSSTVGMAGMVEDGATDKPQRRHRATGRPFCTGAPAFNVYCRERCTAGSGAASDGGGGRHAGVRFLPRLQGWCATFFIPSFLPFRMGMREGGRLREGCWEGGRDKGGLQDQKEVGWKEGGQKLRSNEGVEKYGMTGEL